MANLTLLKGYSNYFERIIKREEKLKGYYDKAETFENLEHINFNPNDGVDAEQIINWTEDWSPDYVVVSDEYENIKSRWFVLDTIRTRGKQFKMVLRRDVLADNYKQILNAPIYVEKGHLNKDDPFIYNTEHMNFNEIKSGQEKLKDNSKCAWLVGYYDQKEKSTDNQGKTTEIGVQTYNFTSSTDLLGNIVNYEDLNYLQKKIFDDIIVSDSKTIEILNAKKSKFQLLLALGYFYKNWLGVPEREAVVNIEGYEQNKSSYLSKGVNIYDVSNCILNGFPEDSSYNNYEFYDKTSKQRYVDFLNIFRNYGILNYKDNGNYDYDIEFSSNFQSAIVQDMYKYIEEQGLKYTKLSDNTIDTYTFDAQDQLFNDALKLNQKIIRKDNKYYQISGLNIYVEKPIGNTSFLTFSQLLKTTNKNKFGYNIYKALEESLTSKLDSTLIEPYGYFRTEIYSATLKLDVISSQKDSYTININKNNGTEEKPKYLYHKHCADSSYDIFLIPYTDNLFVSLDGNNYQKIENFNKKNALLYARSLLSGSNGKICYDVQLFPYFVLSDNIIGPKTDENNLYLNLINTFEDYDYSLINKNNADGTKELSGYLIWSNKSVKEFNIKLNNKFLELGKTSEEIKIQNDCEFVRLCSPNYSGLFDFNVAKNKGVEFFNIDFKLKPFNPYIHVNPNFKELYGSDYNDSRGLICGGDFSLGYTTDNWTQYELNNKNYQQMFDREIKNMDTNHTYDMVSGAIGSVLGAGGSGIAAGGAAKMAGMAAAGPIGLAVGAASAIGGIADLGMAEGRYQEQKSFKTDMFNMSLENIKAQPSSIAKVSAFTPNNQIFPFLEFYSCTDIEKEAFLNKMKYNGMTIGRVDLLTNYISGQRHYFKGQLIRCEEITDDTHIKNAIYEEINKGVYI